MNGAQIHLLLNHMPLFLPAIGAGLVAFGLIAKSRDNRNMGAGLILIGAIAAIAVYLTGEGAENILKNYPGSSRLLIEDHAAAALPTLIMLELSGAASLVLLYGSRTKKAFGEKRWVWGMLLLLSAVALIAVARTAHLGGLIRHEEIRGNDRY